MRWKAGDDVTRHLAAELEDVFAEVGFDRLNAVFFQVIVEGSFLADHRLAFGDCAGGGVAADGKDGVTGVLGGGAPVHLAAGGFDPGGKFLKVEVEMGESVVFDVAGDVAELFEFRQSGGRGGAVGDEGEPLRARAFCRPASFRASRAAVLKAELVGMCISVVNRQ